MPAWTCGWATASCKAQLEPLTTLAYLAAITVERGSALRSAAGAAPADGAGTHAFESRSALERAAGPWLGVGWGLPEIVREWEACGREHKRRAKDLEEHVIVWRKLWSWEPVTYEGKGFKLTGQTLGPLPWSEAGPPILITAGNRGEIIPAQIDRVGRLGDGVVTTYLTDEDCRKLRALCDEALANTTARGRDFPCASIPPCASRTAAKAEALTRDFLQKYYWRRREFSRLDGARAGRRGRRNLQRYEQAGVTDLCIRFAVQTRCRSWKHSSGTSPRPLSSK
jgi:alkanesulfonate monooxygenase SsuD/methylene tetrahydromethanopterin reductase-like flavin-dependent oxidoreductase (luciferase family)